MPIFSQKSLIDLSRKNGGLFRMNTTFCPQISFLCHPETLVIQSASLEASGSFSLESSSALSSSSEFVLHLSLHPTTLPELFCQPLSWYGYEMPKMALSVSTRFKPKSQMIYISLLFDKDLDSKSELKMLRNDIGYTEIHQQLIQCRYEKVASLFTSTENGVSLLLRPESE